MYRVVKLENGSTIIDSQLSKIEAINLADTEVNAIWSRLEGSREEGDSWGHCNINDERPEAFVHVKTCLVYFLVEEMDDED